MLLGHAAGQTAEHDGLPPLRHSVGDSEWETAARTAAARLS